MLHALPLSSTNKKMRICETIIVPLVLYGCEILSLTLREECTLGVFENRVLGRIFGSERAEMAAAWTTLHNVELHNLYGQHCIMWSFITCTDNTA
jgi:hypothetical protein